MPGVETQSPEAAYATKPNIVAGTPYKVVLLGDSLTKANQAQPDRWGYGFQLARLANGWPQIINKGKSGDRTTDILARLTADVLNLRPAEVIVLAGINDVNDGTVAATIQANLGSIYSQCQNAGIAVRPVLIPPYASGWTSGEETVRRAVNDWIRVQGFRYVDLDPVLADYTDPTHPVLKNEYEDLDGLHPNAAGEAVLAEQIFRQALLGGPAAR